MSTVAVRNKLVLGADSAGMFLTPEEFDAIEDYDENCRYELIRGVLVVSPIPSEAQADSNEDLAYLLRHYQESHRRGAALNLTLPERYIRVPGGRRLADRVIWAGLGRQPNPKTDVPTIAVEFVSAGKRNRLRDYEAKRDEYKAAGVKEYWVIDRFRRMLTVYRADGTELKISANKTYRTPLLPGFALPLARLLAIADRWASPSD